MNKLEGITSGPSSEDIKTDGEYCPECGELWEYCDCDNYSRGFDNGK